MHLNEDDRANFGHVYDWMEDYTLPEDYTQTDQEDLLRSLYDDMMVMVDNPVSFEVWKRDYSRYFEVYNPAQEELLQEAFDIKYEQTEKLFDLKTKQEERDYDLIEKYASVDDFDDFESSTEMSIRHSKEQELIDQKMARYKLTSEGLNLNQKKEIASDKSLLKSLRTGKSDAIVDELDRTFWDNMKVVRSEYDKQRLEKTQALDALILKSDQVVESAFKSKTDTLDTLFQSAETNMKNAAVTLIGDQLELREDYDEELWDTMYELAAGDAFLSTCEGITCLDGSCVDKEEDCPEPSACVDSWNSFECGNGECAQSECLCSKNQGDNPENPSCLENVDVGNQTQDCSPDGDQCHGLSPDVTFGGSTCSQACLGTPGGNFHINTFIQQAAAERDAECGEGNHAEWSHASGAWMCVGDAVESYAETWEEPCEVNDAGQTICP